ncbi:hypothetical protein IV494_14160 [Kaistella sp. G5-32]|uniref:Uracil DNA glycosylase superfamily protein n=1 Tax=Kaistella gelatinilytica TaxID=2787636 RepID=A0ABS0FF64_9FLAO|nr:hypothetical protein [Kaistella gelatinilytica]MBF8458324.1 hypothetical protein [Kaistella gelatinilytica]
MINLNSQIAKLIDIEKEICTFPNTMVDGAINNEVFLNSKYKIAWFLKESYSEDDGSQYYRDLFTAENLYEDFFKNVATPTWHPIIYISYAILNNFQKWNDLPDIKEFPQMAEVIHNIAILNANKEYSKTGTFTTDDNLKKGFEKFKSIILRQINILNPDILIFGNTFHLYKEIFVTDEDKIEELSTNGLLHTYYKNGKIYLDAYHPASRKKDYVNSIIIAVEKLQNKIR